MGGSSPEFGSGGTRVHRGGPRSGHATQDEWVDPVQNNFIDLEVLEKVEFKQIITQIIDASDQSDRTDWTDLIDQTEWIKTVRLIESNHQRI